MVEFTDKELEVLQRLVRRALISQSRRRSQPNPGGRDAQFYKVNGLQAISEKLEEMKLAR